MVVYLQPLKKRNDQVAQLVEHLPFKERVLGSSPSPVTKKLFASYRIAFFNIKTSTASMAELVDARA